MFFNLNNHVFEDTEITKFVWQVVENILNDLRRQISRTAQISYFPEDHDLMAGSSQPVWLDLNHFRIASAGQIGNFLKKILRHTCQITIEMDCRAHESV